MYSCDLVKMCTNDFCYNREKPIMSNAGEMYHETLISWNLFSTMRDLSSDESL